MSQPSLTRVMAGALDSRELQRAIGRRSLRARFVLAIGALVALVLVTVSVVLAILVRGYLRQELEKHSRSYAQLAVGPVCEAYQTYFESGFSKFRELLMQTTALDPDLEALAIYDTEEQLLYESSGLASGRAALAPPPAPAVREKARFGRGIRGLELDAWTERGADGRERFVVVAPSVEQWGRHRYSVAFFFSYEGLQVAARSARGQILALGFVALALGVGCAFLLSAQALGPVQELTRGARRLAEGDLHHRIGLRTGDEFEILARTLDQMASRLKENVEDLESSNERLEKLNEELKQLDRTKSDLLANVSHELRTPLTAISGYVEAMQEGLLGDLDPAQTDALAVMERNVRRLRAMIDQLLNYARMESGRLEIELRPFDLEPVARHVVEAIKAIHGPRLELALETPPFIPEVYGDPGRIGQVIENLLTNAVKFSPEGSPISLRIYDTPRGIEVEVRDQGVGIPREAQEKIFERFYQVDASSRRKYGGMGLGLAIVREILDHHHSQIEVESAPGKGSVFRFVLPVATERTGIIPIVSRFKTVVIDDDSTFVNKLAAHLSRRGWAVDTLATGEHAISTIRRVKPDAVVLDRMLPDDDGFDLLTRLKEDPETRAVPVVVVSVRSERALGLRLGAERYLTKPVEPKAVEKALRQVVAEAKGVAAPAPAEEAPPPA